MCLLFWVDGYFDSSWKQRFIEHFDESLLMEMSIINSKKVNNFLPLQLLLHFHLLNLTSFPLPNLTQHIDNNTTLSSIHVATNNLQMSLLLMPLTLIKFYLIILIKHELVVVLIIIVVVVFMLLFQLRLGVKLLVTIVVGGGHVN